MAKKKRKRYKPARGSEHRASKRAAKRVQRKLDKKRGGI